jgi:hypothetical protein
VFLSRDVRYEKAMIARSSNRFCYFLDARRTRTEMPLRDGEDSNCRAMPKVMVVINHERTVHNRDCLATVNTLQDGNVDWVSR